LIGEGEKGGEVDKKSTLIKRRIKGRLFAG